MVNTSYSLREFVSIWAEEKDIIVGLALKVGVWEDLDWEDFQYNYFNVWVQ